MMARVVARVPVVVLIDAPLAGLAVPLALTAPLRIVTERAELRLAGSSLAGTSLGPLAHLPVHATRYLAYVPIFARHRVRCWLTHVGTGRRPELTGLPPLRRTAPT